MKRENNRNPIYYKDKEEMEHPISELVESLRNDISKVRGKLYDIRASFGFNDHIEPLEGGLTCMISAMYNTMEKFKEHEERWSKKSDNELS